ncbi:replication initiation factor domain-containing protein [Paucibacter sp. JuS9]|uniref:replication initiation factor domain-containing protein n=1 Tax=Paucibacter sp. JuS9 TaxID=3228748 RepID=UPI003757413A
MAGWTTNPQELVSGVDQETGEPVAVTSLGMGRLRATRLLERDESVSPAIAFIDALAFSITPPRGETYAWVLAQMSQFLDLGPIEPRGGLFGFQRSARLGDGAGVMAWGGESQKGVVYFSLMGQGCARVQDWQRLALWLEQNKATIKRADVAHDDFDGAYVSIDWAVGQYHSGGFNAGGRKPRAECLGDWLDGNESTHGRTLGIGNRQSGKYARCYEKGKQLGDGASLWTRIEVEWRAQDRYIPYDILLRPGYYLAGAYPCLAFVSAEQSVIKTVSKSVQVSFERAVENAKQHCGKLVNLMLRVYVGDCGEVVHRLVRDGLPGRVAPYSYHLTADPSVCIGEAA